MQRAYSTPRVIVGLLEATALVAVAYVLGLGFHRQDMFSSDMLLPAQYAWDIFNNDYAWANFQLPRIPSLIPDLATYLPLHYWFGFRWGYFLYAVFQIAAFAFSGGAIIAHVTGTRWLRASALLLFIFGSLFIVNWRLPGANLNQILVPVVHFGALLCSLVAVLAVLKLIEHWRTDLAILLLLVGFGAFVSNKMYAAEFIGPAVVSLGALAGVGAMPWKRAVLLSGLCILGPALSPLADSFLTRQPDTSVTFNYGPEQLRRFLGILPVWITNAGFALSVILPLVWWLLAPFYPGLGRRTADEKPRHPEELPPWLARHFGSGRVLFTWLFACLTAAGSLVIEAGKFESGDPSRYVVALMFWPQICLAILLLDLPVRPWLVRLAFPAAVLLALGLYASGVGENRGLRPSALNWRQPEAVCVAEKREALGLKAGLAGYWLASSSMATLDWTMQINQVDQEGRAAQWGNDLMWYWHSAQDASKRPPYNFIIVNQLHEDEIRRRYGPPDRTGNCGSTRIWVYNDEDRFFERLITGSRDLDPVTLKVTGQLCVPGKLLPSWTGRIVGDGRVASLGDSANHLTFGPYFALNKGRYAVSITYAASGITGAPNTWDIGTNANGTAYKGPLPDTQGVASTLEHVFDAAKDTRGLEVRSFYAGTGTLEVDRVCLRKAG